MTFSFMSIIEDAYENIDRQLNTLTSRDLGTARRSLETLFAQWGNDDVNIWKITEGSTATVASTSDYTIGTAGTPIVDLLNVSLRDSNSYDVTLEQISQAEYQRLPLKSQTGKPTQYTTFRNLNGVTLKLYPVPDAVYTLIYHTINYIAEPGTYDGSIDLPRKFKPALIYGLAYLLALKNSMELGPNGEMIKEGVSPQKRQELRATYQEFYTKAKDNDRERASFYVVPYMR